MRWIFALMVMVSNAMAGVHVVDGDTLDVNGERFRLYGIDAPEAGQMCQAARGGKWACGTAATKALKRLVNGKTVSCTRSARDKYQRWISTCTAGGRDIGNALVADGLAWAFVKYTREYVRTEAKAKRNLVGVWQAASQTPWEYRARKWQSAESTAPAGCPIKGNISANGKIYHAPWSPWYARTRITLAKGERWFCDEAEAIAAGWRPPA